MSANTAHTVQVATSTEQVSEAKSISRREFLNYLLGGSLALLALESCAAATWFALPHLKYGVENGLFAIDPKIVPAAGSSPLIFPEGKFWLSHTPNGLLALDMTCPFIRQPAFYKWVSPNKRFECPACGSKFSADGKWLVGLGPAGHNLNRYAIEVITPNGKRRTAADGDPVDITGATALIVDTSRKIPGKLIKSTVLNSWDDSCQCVLPPVPPR